MALGVRVPTEQVLHRAQPRVHIVSTGPYNLFTWWAVAFCVHTYVSHGQPDPGRLVAQPLLLVTSERERPHVPVEDVVRDDAVRGRTPKPRQQVRDRRTQAGRPATGGNRLSHRAHPQTFHPDRQR